MREAEAAVEPARRVPVEHVEIDAAPAALQRDRREARHQPSANPILARRLGDENVFEEQRRLPEPGREPCVGTAPSRPARRSARRSASRSAGWGRTRAGANRPRWRPPPPGLLENRQLADETEDEAAIGLGRE